MYLLKKGKSAYLEFLRNLSIQYILFSSVMIVAYPLKATCCYWENTSDTLVLIAFVSIWVYATLANVWVLFENVFIGKRINRASRLIKLIGKTGHQYTQAMASYVWRTDRSIFLEIFIIYLLFTFCLVVVVSFGEQSADAFIRFTHHLN